MIAARRYMGGHWYMPPGVHDLWKIEPVRYIPHDVWGRDFDAEQRMARELNDAFEAAERERCAKLRRVLVDPVQEWRRSWGRVRQADATMMLREFDDLPPMPFQAIGGLLIKWRSEAAGKAAEAARLLRRSREYPLDVQHLYDATRVNTEAATLLQCVTELERAMARG